MILNHLLPRLIGTTETPYNITRNVMNMLIILGGSSLSILVGAHISKCFRRALKVSPRAEYIRDLQDLLVSSTDAIRFDKRQFLPCQVCLTQRCHRHQIMPSQLNSPSICVYRTINQKKVIDSKILIPSIPNNSNYPKKRSQIFLRSAPFPPPTN